VSYRQELADKLGLEQWDDEILAQFALRQTERDSVLGLHGPKPEAVERAAKSIAIALGYDLAAWRDFQLHAQAALIGALDPVNRFSEQ
jgi:hypothetical protein